jgi:hypothetical protein
LPQPVPQGVVRRTGLVVLLVPLVVLEPVVVLVPLVPVVVPLALVG